VGADISAPLVALAGRRAAERQAENVSFVEGDVQRATVDGGPFDVAASQFGVMFFDEPVTAFANIRRQVAPGGRLGFACWQEIEKNPWFVGKALAGLAPPPPQPGPGKSPSGPFAFGDPERVGEILAGAGWRSVARAPYEMTVSVEPDAIIDDAQLTFLGVPDDKLDIARQAVDEHLQRLRSGDGRINAPLAVQVFTATA
jgi:SAM-dependent methyltransferase